jgi:phosphate transport system ATP-binding protein
LDEIVEKSLRDAVLWDEVKADLKENALGFSLGQQQRICIARVLAVKPEVILFDESTSALDPIATGGIEDLIAELKKQYTIVIVTHNMQQAGRVADFTGLFWLGELVEFGATERLFTRPQKELTEAYLTGKMG